MQSLEHFQRQTAQALLDSAVACPEAVAARQAAARTRRFNVYRNNRAVSLVENLQSTYPAVERLVGPEFFAAAARAFIDAEPPSGPVMAEFGADLGAFVAALPTAKSIPYIADVARIEWSRNLAYHAADQEPLTPNTLAALPPESLPELVLSLHSAVRIVDSNWPVGSIWAATQSESGDPLDMNQGEFVVIARPAWDVAVHVLAPQTATFFRMLAIGEPIGIAAETVLEQYADFDIGAHFGHLLGLGLFSQYSFGSQSN